MDIPAVQQCLEDPEVQAYLATGKSELGTD